MLAESGAANLVILAIIVIAVIVRGIVEYVRRQKAEREAGDRRLREAGDAEREGGAAGPGPAERPVAGGLQALLDALEGRAGGPAKEEPPPGSGDVWDVTGETSREGESVMEPATLEHERARAAEAARPRTSPSSEGYREAHLVRAALAEPSEEEGPAPDETAGLSGLGPEGAAGPPLAALVAAGLLAGPGAPPVRDQARRGVLWSVILGPPRGVVPYGERGAGEPPGGIA